MARPIEPTPALEGDEALRFLEEKERIESLKPGDPEYEERKKFFKECEEISRRYPNLSIFSVKD
jgi:hypothetical protein